VCMVGFESEIGVYDIEEEPFDLEMVGRYDGLGTYWGAFSSACRYTGGYIYFVTWEKGLQILHYSGDTVEVGEGSEGNRRNLELKMPSLLGGRSVPMDLSVPRDGVVKLELYDVSGRRVRELWRGYVNKGNRRIEVDLGGLGSGVYFLRADAGREISVKKIILVR